MGSDSVSVPPGPKTTPLNFIYACSVCCFSFADVYDGHCNTVQGLSDGINPKERLVTRIYLASCCHVFCSKHLEHGAPPFHPEGQRPQAACPVCTQETGDSTPRDLYSIRGFGKDEHDPTIPAIWFDVPPLKLDDKGEEMEALKFQYLALVRYCQHTYATRKPLQDALVQSAKKLDTMKHALDEEQSKSSKLQIEVERLSSVESVSQAADDSSERLLELKKEIEQYRQLRIGAKDLATFKTNKKAITQYLKLVPTLVEQNQRMRERLASLGFAMALEPVPNLKSLDIHTFDDDSGSNTDRLPATSSSRKMPFSSHDGGFSQVSQIVDSPQTSFPVRPTKRQRLDSSHGPYEKSSTDRELMPPPQKPRSRRLSVRKIMPTLRRKFNAGPSRQAPEEFQDEDLHLNDLPQFPGLPNSHDDLAVAQYDHLHTTLTAPETFQAMQTRKQPRSPIAQQFTGIDVNSNRSQFTFRSPSGLKRAHEDSHARNVLPQEPSYLRLMDGLSHHDSIELGLQDPRETNSQQYGPVNDAKPAFSMQSTERNGQTFGSQLSWNSGLPQFVRKPLHQSRFPETPRQGHTYRDQGHDQPSLIDDSQRPMPVTPVTRKPSPQRFPMDNVVSSSSKSVYRTTPVLHKTILAEVRGSSTPFDDYPYRDLGKIDGAQRWGAPRGLNGLSFFDTPLDSQGRPIRYNDSRVQADESLHTPKGSNSRPRNQLELDSSPFFSRNSLRKSHNHETTRGTRPYSSFTKVNTQNRHLPDQHHTGPLTLRARERPQWQKLQRAGVRSSRQGFPTQMSDSHHHYERHLYSRTGFQSIRR